MVDTYYSDLARKALHKAYGELQSAQEYLRDAGLPDEIVKVQKIISTVRAQSDELMRFERQKDDEWSK